MTTEPEIFARMRELDRVEKLSYAERGELCLWVKRHMLHNQRINPETNEPCSLTEWVRLCSPWGYASSFSAMRDFEMLSDVPMEDLAEMSKGNIQTLIQLSTAVRSQPSILQAAKTQRPDEFIEHVRRTNPMQHLDTKRTLRFVADSGQAAEIEETIVIAMGQGAMNRTEALLSICLDYRATVKLEEMSHEGK